MRIASLALLACGCAAARPAAAPADPSTFDVGAIDACAARTLAEQRVPGAALAIVRDGKTVLAKGYGARSRATGAAADADTAFAIGSLSKQFTCAALLLLQEEGRLSLRDPLSKYYPELPRAAQITLLDLLNHVSGYRDYYPLDFIDRRLLQSIDPDQLIARYAGSKLDFEPGTRWSYSNTGFVIAGRVVERSAAKLSVHFFRGASSARWD
jgi:CubicO group peptidase (beta-lactamase class C family)